jgi:uncharacterized repeat protein (TIGR01451 family)
MRSVYLKGFAATVAIAVAALIGGSSALGVTADVSITVTDGSATEVPGTTVTYTITVTNPGTGNLKKVAVADAFPSTITGVQWGCVPGAGGACALASGSGNINTTVDLNGGTSAVFTATGTIAASAFPSLADTATAAVPRGSTDPTPSNNTSTDVDTLTPVADLVLDSAGVAPSTAFGNDVASQNTLAFSVALHNAGPSDARHTTLKFSPQLSSLLGSAEWCKVAGNVNCTQDNQFSPLNITTGADLGQLAPGATLTNVVVRAHALSSDRDGPLTDSQPFMLSVPAPTTDPDSSNNSGPSPAPSFQIDTVPSPVQNLQAVLGNGNVILTWQKPANDSGHPVDQYRVTINGGSQILIDPATAPQVLCPNGTSADCFRVNVGNLTNDTHYTLAVQAHNAVGYSDASQLVATPSREAASQIVSGSTATVFSTCTTATSTQQTCVQYRIPSGGGGVFGAAGGGIVQPLVPPGFCGQSNCAPNTGAQITGSLEGYNDPTHPLVEVITWDSSTIPANWPINPICSTNSTAINCFPNNLPVYYEMSFTLLNFPSEASTGLNVPDSSGHMHFCADPVSQGGAGNVNFARPKPATGGLPQFNGYTDSAGSACISSFSVQTGLPGRPNQKGDVQMVINLTSDSDALGMRK